MSAPTKEFYRLLMEGRIIHGEMCIRDRDMKGDKQFPHDGDKAKIQEYLDGCGACSGCMDAFEEAWACLLYTSRCV